MSEWGSRIAGRRKEIGMSLSALARQVGVAVATAHDWESGKTAKLPSNALLRIADVLGVTPSFIMGDGGGGTTTTVDGSMGARIRRMRMQREMTQADLAKAAGLTQQAIGAIERGSAKPDTDAVLSIARAFDISPADLSAPLAPVWAAPSQPSRPDRSTLLTAIQVVEEVLASMGITYPPKQRADLIMGCYLALEAGQKAAAARTVVASLLEAQRIKT